MTDDEYFDELDLIESELMDEYVRNAVSADERARLENRLLRSKYQQYQLVLATAFHVEKKEKAKVIPLVVPSAKTASFSPYLKIAAALVIAAGLLISLLVLIGRKSDVERGMIALNEAQGNERLIQSRISELNYGEFRAVRGNRAGLKDRQARDYSERLLQDAVNQKQDAESYHALGRLYLAERDFIKAGEQFAKALQKDQNDPQLLSDMGATLFELAQLSDETERLPQLNEALNYFQRAVELNPRLPEAYFNGALVIQYLKHPEAKDAWRNYLRIDSTSPWAREAERNLKLLDAQ